jgi:peptide/nickel transport system permease protein
VLTFLLRRVVWAMALVIVVTICTFVIFFVIPTDPLQVGIGRQASFVTVRDGVPVTGPLYEQYLKYMWNIVGEGSLGTSLYGTHREVLDIIAEAAPVTIGLIVGGALMWLLIAIPVGIVSALRPRSVLDRVGMAFVLVGVSAHPVWVGLLLSYFLGFKLGVTPITGYCDLWNPTWDCGGPVQYFWFMLLPWLTFALMFAAFYARMVRGMLIEALDEDYVRTARAKGASDARVVRVHVFRNVLLPVVTMLGMDIGRVSLFNVFFVESVFSLPGLGRVTLAAFTRRDLPVLMGVTIMITLAIVLLNLIVDLVHAALDPRVRAREPVSTDTQRGRTPVHRPAEPAAEPAS